MDLSRFQAIQRYVDFTPASAERLRRFYEAAETELDPVIGDFYDAIRRDPDAAAVLTGGAAQVERLKSTLHQWLRTLLLGPYDETYVASRNRIGQVHVRINLSQEYMLTAMNRVRQGLHTIAVRNVSRSEVTETLDAINRVLDLDLALMLDTYRQSWLSRVDASARLAAVGQIAASIGHELRNPLGVASSSLYLINQRLTKLSSTDEVLAKHLSRIENQLHACSETITSLLDMVRDTPIVRSHFPLEPLVTECVDNTPRADAVSVTVAIPAVLHVDADREQLGAVIGNLLSNAFQALESSTDKHVSVSANEAHGGVELIVSDTGPGIDAHNERRIFDVLFTTRARGNGLGLALCKKIVERHGGEIGLAPGSTAGARFRVWLPNAAPKAPHSSVKYVKVTP